MSDPFEGILAQDVAVRILQNAVISDRMPGAYLFDGPSGVGKQLAALALAKAVLGNQHSARIDGLKHPDVRVFPPREDGHRNIRVEFLREEILPYAEFAPFEGDAAFLIFPEADVSFPAAHPESANAILKTLEEPKKGVTFVLLAERPDRLLPTIRSRCQRVRFARLSREALEAVLATHNTSPELVGPAAALADGSADRALALCEEGAATRLFELALRVDDVTAGANPGALIDVAEELAKHADLSAALHGVSLFYRDVALSAVGIGADKLAFRHESDRVSHRAARMGAARASARVELLRAVRDDLESNANKQVAMDALLFRLRSVR